MNKPETADQHRARIEAAHAAASTPTGGSFIRQKDGTLVPDPNGVSTQAAAPAGDIDAASVAVVAGVAVVTTAEAADPSAQNAAKKSR